ncbi:MAG: sensor histidine kinase [Flavobacteriales bacterium]
MPIRSPIALVRIGPLLILLLFGTGEAVHAADLLRVHRRFIDLGVRDDSPSQSRLIDSLLADPHIDDNGRTLTAILKARMALVRGFADEAEALLRPLVIREGTDPVLLYAHAETASNIHKGKRAWLEAMAEADRAMHLAEAYKMDREQVDMLMLRASIERGKSDYSAALDLAMTAEKKAEALGYMAGLSKALVMRGNIYYDRNQPDMAKVYYRRCFQLAIASGFKQHVKLCIGNLAGAIQQDPDSSEAAILVYEQAIGYAQRTGDQDLEADWRANMGSVLADAGKFDRARTEIGRALTFYESRNDTVNQLDALYYLADVYGSSGKIDTALALAERCLALSKAVPVLPRIVDSEWLICQLLTASDSPMLKGHLAEYKRMRDSLEINIANEMLYEKEVQFDTEKKEILLSKTELERDAEIAVRKRREIQRNAVIAVSVLLILLSFILNRNLRHRKRLAKKERELYEQQMGDVMRQSEIRSLDSLMQGQEMERKRVAKDLHDRLGSMLSAIKLQFSALESKVEKVREENREQYDHVFSMLDDAVGEVRRISHDMLKSSLAQFGLAGALDDLRQALSAPGKLEVEMSLFGLEQRLEQKIEIAVFRMVQECVGNALKHAKATAISIEVTRSTAMLNVIVEDNGKGFDTGKVNEGMGLGNLRQRAAEVGGAVQFDSRPGRGTIITIDVPLG